MRVPAPTPANGTGARQSGLVDEPPDQKAVFRLQGTALPRGKARKLPLGSEFRHKRHGNAPGITREYLHLSRHAIFLATLQGVLESCNVELHSHYYNY